MTTGGFMDMDMAGTENVFATLSVKATTLDAFWNRAQRTIATGESGIGGDRIAQAFRGNSDPTSNAVRRDADPLPGAYLDLVTVGRRAAALYQEADLTSAQEIGGGR